MPVQRSPEQARKELAAIAASKKKVKVKVKPFNPIDIFDLKTPDGGTVNPLRGTPLDQSKPSGKPPRATDWREDPGGGYVEQHSGQTVPIAPDAKSRAAQAKDFRRIKRLERQRARAEALAKWSMEKARKDFLDSQKPEGASIFGWHPPAHGALGNWFATQLNDVAHIPVGLGKLGVENFKTFYGHPQDYPSFFWNTVGDMVGNEGGLFTYIPDPTSKKDMQRFRDAWTHHTALGVLAAAPVVGAATRLGEASAIAGRASRPIPKVELASEADHAIIGSWADETGVARNAARAIYNDPENVIVIRGPGGRPTAVAHIGRDKGNIIVHDIAADPAFRGAGTELLDGIKGIAAKEGKGVRSPEVASEAAQRWHQKNGLMPKKGKTTEHSISAAQVKRWANPGWREAMRETKRPGYMAGQGIEGGIAPRVLRTGKNPSRTIDLELTRGPGNLGDNLDTAQTTLVQQHMEPAIRQIVDETPGVELVDINHGVSGWAGGTNASLHVGVRGSDAAIHRLTTKFAKAFDQELVQASTTGKGKNSAQALVVTGQVFADPATKLAFFQRLNQIMPELEGFMPVVREGDPGIAIRTTHKSPRGFLDRYAAAVQQTAQEMGVPVKAGSENMDLLIGSQRGRASSLDAQGGVGAVPRQDLSPTEAAVRNELEKTIEKVQNPPRVLTAAEAEALTPVEGMYYHGTTADAAQQIMADGELRPSAPERSAGEGRAEVWLSADPKYAAFRGEAVIEVNKAYLPEGTEFIPRFGGMASSEVPINLRVPEPRALSLPGSGVEEVGAARPWARSSMGRVIQRGYDNMSSRFGDSMFSDTFGGKYTPSHRAARVFEKLDRKRKQHFAAWLQRRERTIHRATREDPAKMEGLLAVLEAPEALGFRESVETKINHLEQIDNPPANIVNQITLLRSVLEGDFLEGNNFHAAVTSAREMSDMADAMAGEVLGMTPDELTARRDLVSQSWADAGLLPEGMPVSARGYFPHRSVFDPQRPVTPNASLPGGNVVGVPQKGKVFTRKQNEMKRYAAGTVDTRPQSLAQTLRGRDAYLSKVTARVYLYERGKPVTIGEPIPEGWFFVRNPLDTPTRLQAEAKMAVSDPEAALVKNDPYVMKAEDWHAANDAGTLPPEWAKGIENVRMVDPSIVKAVLSDSTKGSGNVHSALGLLNAISRSVILHLPYGGTRYVLRNSAQNMLLMAITHPSAYGELVTNVARLYRSDRAFFDRIQVEAGTIQAGAGLPEVFRGGTRLQKVERGVTQGKDWIVPVGGERAFVVNPGLKSWGQKLGWAADEPYRVAAWIKYAKEYGFKNKAAWERLMNSTRPADVEIRNNISQYVKEDMIDFDTLNPYEREVVSRVTFIYPFIKGASKWPLIFVRDYPFRAGVMALIGAQAQREGIPGMPQNEAEINKVGTHQFAWLSPVDPMFQNVQSGIALVNGFAGGNFDLSPLADFGAPWLRAMGTASFGGGMTPENFAKTFVPGYTTYKGVKKGGGPVDQFGRMMGYDQQTPDFRLKEHADDRAKLIEDWKLVGENYDMGAVVTGFKAQQEYKDLVKRGEFAAKDLGRKLTPKERAKLLTYVGLKYAPDAGWPSYEKIDAGSDFTDYINLAEDTLWGEVTRVKSAASRARSDAKNG